VRGILTLKYSLELGMRKIKLPGGDVDASVPEFRPDPTTMERLDTDPMTLWRACDQWWELVLHPPTDPPEFDHEFNQLTEALQLWASLHGLGDGGALVDGSTLYYSPKARKSGLDWLVRAEAFIQLIKNRGAHRPTAKDEPPKPVLLTAKQAAKELQISERTLHDLTKSGVIPCVRVRRRVMYTRASLATWAEGKANREERKGKRNRKVRNGAVSCDVVRHFGKP
jgi:excisionase family DNA binding protein